MPANAPAKSPPEERLVNLVVALMATDQGLTKDTILSSVAGYREQTESGASKDALERNDHARGGQQIGQQHEHLVSRNAAGHAGGTTAAP